MSPDLNPQQSENFQPQAFTRALVLNVHRCFSLSSFLSFTKPNKSHDDFDFATAKTRQRQLNTIWGGEVRRKRQINCGIIAKQNGQKSAKQPSTCILRCHSYGLLPSHFLGLFTGLLQLFASPLLNSFPLTCLVFTWFFLSHRFRFQSFLCQITTLLNGFSS